MLYGLDKYHGSSTSMWRASATWRCFTYLYLGVLEAGLRSFRCLYLSMNSLPKPLLSFSSHSNLGIQ